MQPDYKGCVLEFVATVRHINPDLISGPLTQLATLYHKSTGPLSRLNTTKTLYQSNFDLKLCV